MEQNFYWTSKVHEGMNDEKKTNEMGLVNERRTNVLKKRRCPSQETHMILQRNLKQKS